MLIAIKDLDLYISDGNYSAKYPRSDEFVDSGIPFIRANNFVEGDISDDEMYFITPEKHSVLLKGHVKSGDVLITTRGNIGQVAVVPERHEDSNINAQIVLFRTKPEKLYNRYLFWALQSQSANEQYYSLQTGTALKQLPVGKLERLKINVTSIKEQHRIADNLDKAYKVIKERRKELVLLDNLIKARFVEVISQSNSIDIKLKDVVETDRIITYGMVKPGKDVEGGVIIIKVKDFPNGIIQTNDFLHSDPELESKYARSRVKAGDLLYSIRGTVGRTAFVTPELEGANITQDTARLSIDTKRFNPNYIRFALGYDEVVRAVESQIKGVAMKGISLSELREIEIPCVDYDAQQVFGEFVEQVDKSKFNF